MNSNVIAIDIAKEVFQLCKVDKKGKIVMEKRLTRGKLLPFMRQQSPTLIVMEACGGGNHWTREFKALGHEVKLIAPQYVKPFVKGNKNDKRDARAIAEAAQRPQMTFVQPKSVEQQDIQSLLRIREGYVTMRTKLINQLRGLLAEYGLVLSKQVSSMRKALPDLYDPESDNGLSLQMKQLLSQQYTTLLLFDEHIDICDLEIKRLAAGQEACQRLQAIEGVGPVTALALVAQVGDASVFKNGRHFAAYLGLVPRQHSSGNKQQLLGISKRGDGHLRRLLVHGARSVLIRTPGKTDSRSRWVESIKERKGHNKAAVALANKNARIVLALLKNDDVYRVAA